jgi:hypothetical protein
MARSSTFSAFHPERGECIADDASWPRLSADGWVKGSAEVASPSPAQSEGEAPLPSKGEGEGEDEGKGQEE